MRARSTRRAAALAAGAAIVVAAVAPGASGGAARRAPRMAAPAIPSTPSVARYWGVKQGNTRTYTITAQQFAQQIANFPIRTAQFWGFGAPGIAPSTPGPTLLARQGERIRLVVKNDLPVPTSIHPHGLHEQNAADGVSGIDFTPIAPGETRTYPVFKPAHAGTFAYHTHTDTATQEPRGMAGLFIVLPRRVAAAERPDVDVGFTLQSFNPPGEGQLVKTMPNDVGMFPFNTMNGRTGDASGGPIAIRKGDLVQIRIYNASEMVHSMHLHGHDLKLVAINGHPVTPRTVTTQAIAPGEFFTLRFRANNPGNWLFHCSFPGHQANDSKSGYQGAPVGMTRVFHYTTAPPVPPAYFSFAG